MSYIKVGSKAYKRIHAWLNYHYGKADHCDLCKNIENKRFSWALKKGFNYSKNVEHFIQLCKSCHVKYDINDLTKIKMSISAKIRIKNNPIILTEKSKKKMSESAHIRMVGNKRSVGNKAKRKVTPKIYNDILSLRMKKFTLLEISKIIGLSKSTIGNVCNCKYNYN